MDTLFSDLRSFLLASFPVITLVMIIAFGLIIIKCILKLAKTALLQSNIDKLLVKFLLIIIKICLGVFLLLYALSVAGFPLSGFVAALSAITLAIGLAIQDIIAGVASGMMVVTTHPFKIGDYVEVSGQGGSIKEVTLFHTVMTTPDNKKVMIPNKNLFSSEIVNFSSNPTRRLDMVFGIDYICNRDTVFKALLEMASSHPLVLKEPAPVIQIKSYEDYEIMYLVRVWVNNDDYWTVHFDLNREILNVCERYNIDMSYPRLLLSYDKTQDITAKEDSGKNE